MIRSPLLFACALPLLANAQGGVLDPTFDGDGVVQTAVELPSIANAVAVASDGKVLVAGNADSTGTVVRYLPDGSLDSGFGNNGVAVLDVQSACTITDITVLSNGKILVVGKAQLILTGTTESFITVRFNSNGTVDTSFGPNGTGSLTSYLGQQTGTLWEVQVQANGKILTTGTSFAGISTGTRTSRLTANGDYDAGFGTGGEVLYAPVVYNHTNGRSVAAQPDGKVLVGGWFASNTESDRFVRRLTTAGGPDDTFGNGGLATIDAGTGLTEIGSDVLLQNDGNILLVGSASSSTTDQRFRVTRLLADGSIDASYGTEGNAIGPALTGSITPQRGCLQADGKLVFVTNLTNNGGTHTMVWRLNTDGTLDATFGNNGQVTDPCGSGTNLLNDVAQQSDGKLIIGGQGPGGLILTAARLTSGPVGVEEVNTENSISLAPNPNDGRFMLQLGSDVAGPGVILDALGRVVRSFGRLQGSVPIELDDLPSGRYVVRIMDADGAVHIPFVKY